MRQKQSFDSGQSNKKNSTAEINGETQNWSIEVDESLAQNGTYLVNDENFRSLIFVSMVCTYCFSYSKLNSISVYFFNQTVIDFY